MSCLQHLKPTISVQAWNVGNCGQGGGGGGGKALFRASSMAALGLMEDSPVEVADKVEEEEGVYDLGDDDVPHDL
jgi:hypothetical protein